MCLDIIIAVLCLSFLIFFHELGHFLFAKLFHVGVLEFSIGMGPRVFSGIWRNTRYSVKLFPFGGSCAMLGEDSAGSGDFLVAGKEEKDDYYDFEGVQYQKEELDSYDFEKKAAWQRFLICFGGVFHNFLLGLLLAFLVVGISGFDRPYIESAAAESPARESGLQEGDLITAFQLDRGKKHAVLSFRDIQLYLGTHPGSIREGSRIHIWFQRDGEKRETEFSGYRDPASGSFRMGLSFHADFRKPENAGALVQEAFHEVVYNIRAVAYSLRMILHRQISSREVTGPVGTVVVMSSVVKQSDGLRPVVKLIVIMQLMLLLTVNLAVMNLLPIPALDGGRLLFLLLEMLTRRRLPKKLEENINRGGMILLLLLMAVILFNDLHNLFTGTYQRLG